MTRSLAHVLGTAVVLVTAPALAADFTLSQALQEGFANSPKLQRAQSVATGAEWKVSEAWSGFLPRLSVGASHILGKKYALTDIDFGGNPVSVPQIIPGSTFAVNAELPLFDGLASLNRLTSARSMHEAADGDAAWARFQLEREIKSIFYRALGAEALREVAERNLKTLEEHLRDVKNFKEAGISTNFDLLRVEAQVSAAQSDLLDVSDNAVVSRNRLTETLGRESDDRDLSGQLPEPKADWIQSLPAFDVAARPDLKALRARTEAMADLDAAASRYWVPNVSLVGQYTRYNNKSDGWAEWDDFRTAYQVGLQASWNLFDGMRSTARARQASEERYQTEKSLQMARLHAGQDYDLWKRKFLYQCAVYRARLGDVDKANESVRLAKAGRKAGVRTNAELLDAEVDLFRARAGVVNAQMGAVEAFLNLEMASGRDLAAL